MEARVWEGFGTHVWREGATCPLIPEKALESIACWLGVEARKRKGIGAQRWGGGGKE